MDLKGFFHESCSLNNLVLSVHTTILKIHSTLLTLAEHQESCQVSDPFCTTAYTALPYHKLLSIGIILLLLHFTSIAQQKEFLASTTNPR